MKDSTKPKQDELEIAKAALPRPLKSHFKEAQELDAIWAGEIAALKLRTFPSIASAIEAVIDSVLEKMKLSGDERAKTASALKEMFQDNPMVEDSLRFNLEIKE